MKALVTGANGFIGSHLCELLVAEGYQVRGLVRKTSDLTWLEGISGSHKSPATSSETRALTGRFELAYGDLLDGKSLAAAAEGMDWVFHLGGTVRAKDTRDFERVNRDGTRVVADACVGAGVKRFVLFSSAAAAGPAVSREEPRHEGHEPAPVSLYGRGKLGAEMILQELRGRLHSVILRFPAVYGPRDRDIAMMVRWAKRGLMPVFGGVFSSVYVHDAVRAAVLAAESPVESGSVYFISDGNCYEYSNMAQVTEKVFGRRPVKMKVSGWLLQAAGWVSESLAREGSIFNRDKARELAQSCWTCSIDRARAELGFRPEYDLERGMAETIRWYEEMNWL